MTTPRVTVPVDGAEVTITLTGKVSDTMPDRPGWFRVTGHKFIFSATGDDAAIQLSAAPAPEGGAVMRAEDAPVWADGIVTDGERVSMAQKAEADHGGTYWAVDGGDGGLDWEPTHFVSLSALATREEAPAEAGEIDLYDDKVQAGIAWTMRQWGETLGLKTWTMGDGSESVEGDVGAEIHTILVDAGLRDPETNEMAALRAQPQAREEAQPVGVVDGLIGRLNTAELDDGTLLYTTPPAPEAEKLRVAVEALEKAETIFASISRRVPYGHSTMSDATHAAVMVRQALAALQQEGR